jgi:putative nucleotidyltransferase with HDIG domain
MAVAVAAGAVARRKGIGAKPVEEAFIGGLLHDIGKLFLDQYFPDQYAIALKLAAAAKISIWESEKTALGVGHALVGKRIADKWNLPPSLTAMITLHHQPVFAKEHFELAATIQAADHLARRLKLGGAGDALTPPLAPEVEKWLAFTPPVWEALETETCRKFDDSQEFLKVL